MTDAVIDWLLDTDPTVRWQVERDLVGAPEEVWQATCARVTTEGFGARLLALQQEDGMWDGGAYFPAKVADDEPGQPWTATTWSLKALREWGVPADALLPDTVELLDRNCRWEYDRLPFWGGEVDACINAYTLAAGGWLGADVSSIAEWFVEQRLPDGGWNCSWVEGSTRSSFHSTLNVVEGILDHERRTGVDPELRTVRLSGQEYLLERRLMFRRSDGELVGPWATRFAFPFRWQYSALKALDHFRAAALHDGTEPDDRLRDAIELVRDAQHPDGTWHNQTVHAGRTWFDEDAPVGEPSPGLTLRALRVLQWWDSAE